MNGLEIDKRTIEDIINQIKEKAASYTPEWRFDAENMDAGTALAMIYAQMLDNTISKLNCVPEKNRIAFYNKLGAKLLPAIPANGYITFKLVNDEVSGVEVYKNTQMSATNLDGENITFETLNDIYVTPASIETIFLCNKKLDYIAKVYDKKQAKPNNEIALFSYKEENLQQHQFFFSHASVLNIKTEGTIVVSFKLLRQEALSEDVCKILQDENNVIYEYYSEKGYIKFADIKFENGNLLLTKGKDQPQFTFNEENEDKNYWIRCTVKNIEKLELLQVEKISIRSQGSMIKPELINAAGIEPDTKAFYPFGERALLMQEVYFVSEEVLSKKNANIHMSFDLEFGKFEIENPTAEQEYDWKNIMKKSDFKIDPEYDITITNVIWEYYNGTGWTRLFNNEMYADVFNAISDHYQHITINFQCPEDIEPFLVNSVTSYSIRARILKMSNLYKMKGKYISPYMSNVKFKYEYINNQIVPDQLVVCNNLATKVYQGVDLVHSSKVIQLFKSVPFESPTLLFGFGQAPKEGPIKILFSMLNSKIEKMPILNYEYLTKYKWHTLNMVDETENFRKTGIITIMGDDDFYKKEIFNQEMYWIKVSDVDNEFITKHLKYPVVTGIFMNTTQIMAIETMEPEYFDIRSNQENLECILLGNNVFKLSVWINELGQLTESQLKKIEETNEIEYIYSPNGELAQAWVRWKEVDQFNFTYLDERVYMVNKIDGIVSFADGRNGMIPPHANEPTIKIIYCCGGGKVGNLLPGSIRQLNKTIGFISEINNFENTTGGCNQEIVEDSVIRNSLLLRHRNRAVTSTDYENLAMQASRNILKAKCCSNCNVNGEKMYGNITMVLFQKDYLGGAKYFDQIREQVKKYLSTHMSSLVYEQGRLHIIEPHYLVINAKVTLVVNEYNKVFEVKEKVKECIEKFLDPVDGNFDGRGWNIGEAPDETQLLNAIKDIPNVYFIKGVRIDAYKQNNDGIVEVDYSSQKNHPFVLPINGLHKINIEVKE